MKKSYLIIEHEQLYPSRKGPYVFSSNEKPVKNTYRSKINRWIFWTYWIYWIFWMWLNSHTGINIA
jgi:hypothetical protein